jgi:hypothetical protein
VDQKSTSPTDSEVYLLEPIKSHKRKRGPTNDSYLKCAFRRLTLTRKTALLGLTESVYHFGVHQDRHEDVDMDDVSGSDDDATNNMNFESLDNDSLTMSDWSDWEDFKGAHAVDIKEVNDIDIEELNSDHIVRTPILTLQRDYYTLNKFNSISNIWTCVSPQ